MNRPRARKHCEPESVNPSAHLIGLVAPLDLHQLWEDMNLPIPKVLRWIPLQVVPVPYHPWLNPS